MKQSNFNKYFISSIIFVLVMFIAGAYRRQLPAMIFETLFTLSGVNLLVAVVIGPKK